MASYVSNQPIQYNQTTSNINLPLEANVLNTLEGRYNQNKAQIQQVLDAYGSIDLLRDEDKEYLSGKLRDVTENINNAGNRNLARSYVAQDILNKAKTVAKDIVVLDAMESTMNKKNYDSQYSEMCKKDPSKCNDWNYEFGLYKAGYFDYMTGKTNKLGSIKVRPYTDFMSNAIKKAKDLKDLKGEQEIEIPNPSKPGGYIKKKISGLSVDEVLNYFPEILSSEEREQMRIDGWAKMKDLKGYQIEQEANIFFSSKIKLLDDAITEQNAIIKGEGYNQSQKDTATRLKQVYENQKKDYDLLSTQINKQSPEDVGYLFQKESFNKTASALFTGKTSITYDDSGYYAQQKLDLDLRAEKRAIAEHEAKMAKDYGLNPDGTPKPTENTWTQTPEEEQNTPDKKTDYEKAREVYDDSYKTIVKTVESVYNNDIVSEENKKKFLTILKANNYTTQNGKIVSIIPNNKVSKAAAAELAYREAKLDIYDNTADKIITEAHTTRELLVEPLVESKKEFNKNVNPQELASVAPNIIYSENYKNEDYKKKADSFVNFLKANNLIGKPGIIDTSPVILENLSKKLKEDETFKAKYLNYLQDFEKMGRGVNNLIGGLSTALKNQEDTLKKYNINHLLPSKYTNVINITKEADRSKLIQMLPQTIKNTDGEVVSTGVGSFDAKKPLTIKKTTDGYIIEQDMGVFDGADNAGKPKGSITATVYTNSAGYNYIEQNIKSTESVTLSTQSVPKTFAIKPVVKPFFVDNDNKELKEIYVNKLNTNVNKKTLTDISNSITPPNAPFINPAIFLTKEDSKSYFKAILGEKATEEQINKLLKRIDDNFDKYSVKVRPNTNKQNWVLDFNTSNGSVNSTKILTNGTELEKDYGYMVKTFPQILILSEIAKTLIKDPTKIDSI